VTVRVNSNPNHRPNRCAAAGTRRLVYGAHFYDGFYVQPLWRLLGEDVTCTIMTGFLDSRIAVILDEALPNAAPVWLSEVGPAPAWRPFCGPCGSADEPSFWKARRPPGRRQTGPGRQCLQCRGRLV